MSSQGGAEGSVAQVPTGVSERTLQEISLLEQRVQQNRDVLQALKERLAEQQGLIEAYTNAHQSIYRTIELGYDNTLTWYTVIITLVGILGALFFVGYKKREVNKVADDAVNQVEGRLSDPELMATLVAGAIETDKHQETLSRIKNELFDELSDDLKSWLGDKYSGRSFSDDDESESTTKERFKAAIGEPESQS